MNQIIEMLEHWQAGRSIKAIAKSLRVDRQTVRKYVNGVLSAGITRESQLERGEWVKLLQQRFPELDHAQRSPTYPRLQAHQEQLRKALGKNRVITVWKREVVPTLPGLSLSSFRRWVQEVMPEVLTELQVTVWRPEVAPGEEAQLDFAYLGLWPDPVTHKQVRVWAFIMVLSHSRHLLVEPVWRLDRSTWLHCHREAFACFGGVPRRLVVDNLKDGVVKADSYDPELKLEYARLARHYGTIVDPCRAGHPKDKPRVERQVSYVRASLWRGLQFGSCDHLRQHRRRWCVQEAGARMHGTTRWRPYAYYEQHEQPQLLPLPAERFELFELTTAKVTPDAHCRVRKASYSVPFRCVGRTLSVRVGEKTVEFYQGEELVKTHSRRFDRGTSTDLGDLPAEKTAFYLHTPEVCLQQAQHLGMKVHEAVRALLHQRTLAHLPKRAFLTEYSCRIHRETHPRLMQLWFEAMNRLGLPRGTSFDLDFHTIPFHGEDALVEKHYVSKRSRRQKGMLAFLAQDASTRVFCYANSDLRQTERNDEILRFVSFWQQRTGQLPAELIFDSQLTTYANLNRLNHLGIRFITLRRRSRRLLEAIHQTPPSAWRRIELPNIKRAFRTPRILDTQVQLKDYTGPLRQLTITDLGHEEPTLLLTNDRQGSAVQVITRYAQRMVIENQIADGIEFFHMDALSSAVAMKVNCDLQLTLMASSLYRWLGTGVGRGYQTAESQHIFRDLVDAAARVTLTDSEIQVGFHRRAHNPLLVAAGFPNLATPIPWLGNRRLRFIFG